MRTTNKIMIGVTASVVIFIIVFYFVGNILDADEAIGEGGEKNVYVTVVPIGKAANGLGVSVTPAEILEDSRCPTDVTCIQAGTVKVRARLRSALGDAVQVFELEKPVTTEAEEITLTDVRPVAISTVQLEPSDYNFEFTIKKRVIPSIDGLPESSKLPNLPTDFAKRGTITVNNPGQRQGVMYLIYEEPGAPALSKELVLDGESTCATSNGAVPCLAMSVTFDVAFGGRQATVEGLSQGDDRVIARLIRILDEENLGRPERELNTGDLIMSWPSAVRQIETCNVAQAGQTHSLDVYLTLKDGREVRSVEPVIDELFQVIERSRPMCGTFPVSTE